MSPPVEERARLGDRVVLTSTHYARTHDGPQTIRPGHYGTVVIEDFGGEPGVLYVDFVAANGRRFSMPVRDGEYALVRRAGTS